jgi:RNA methyltransferase, TrmH family
MDPITSLQNNRVKLANALLTRARTRRKEGKVVLEGARLVRDAWDNGSRPEFVLYTPGVDNGLVDLLERRRIDALPVDEKVMQYVTDTQSPQGIVGVFPTPQPELPADAQAVLIADAISDPGNLGTLIRSAAGAGVDAVILAPNCVDAYNPKVLRGGMGAHFRLPVLDMTWPQIRERVAAGRVFLADGAGDVPYDAEVWGSESWALIVGSEAHGASDEAVAIATGRVFIPMAHATESLNAAVAAAVILFEAARQRRVDA